MARAIPLAMGTLAIITRNSMAIISSIHHLITSIATGCRILRWAFRRLMGACALRSRTQNGFTIIFLMEQRSLRIKRILHQCLQRKNKSHVFCKRAGCRTGYINGRPIKDI